MCQSGFVGTKMREASISAIGTLAIDLAKNSFQVCGVRCDGVMVFNRAVSRRRREHLLSDQSPFVVAIEACAASHHWSRVAMAHGHDVRLDRAMSGAFGSTAYAFEQLVAELGAAFCCASLGIVPTVRHADYIGSWLEVLRRDSRAIVRAAGLASKAAEYLLGFALDAAEVLAVPPERERALLGVS
jgi:Zincin-like metallopeptidase